jgi:hypothetical protein
MTTETPPADPILVGHITKPEGQAISVIADSPILAPHVGKPWLNGYIRRRFDVSLDVPLGAKKDGDQYFVDAQRMRIGTVICGGIGSGKTRLAMLLIYEQLRRGQSVVLMDVQDKTLFMALDAARKAGLKPDQITLLWTRGREGAPGWNPFAQPMERVKAGVGQFMSLIRPEGGWGVATRMVDLLENAAIVVASLGLTIIDLIEFLENDEYRDGLLPIFYALPESDTLFKPQKKFFQGTFSRWTEKKQGEALDPVMNRIRFFEKVDFMRATVGARRDTLDLPSLWMRQRLILVLLDKEELGSTETAGIVSGLVTRSLLDTCRRVRGPKHVFLCVDELGAQTKFGSSAIEEIITTARQRQLHVMAAFQDMSLIPDRLRSVLLGQTGFRAFMRLGPKDADDVAKSFGGDMGHGIRKVAIRAIRDEVETREYYVLREEGKRVQFDGKEAWQKFELAPEKLKYILEKADGMRLFAQDRELFGKPDAPRYRLVPFMAGVHPSAFQYSGPSPLSITVTFPKPDLEKVTVRRPSELAYDLAEDLKKTPPRFALAWDSGSDRIRVADSDFSDDEVSLDIYMKNGQSVQEILEVERLREEHVKEVSVVREEESSPSVKVVRKKTPHVPLPIPQKPEVMDDGSL